MERAVVGAANHKHHFLDQQENEFKKIPIEELESRYRQQDFLREAKWIFRCCPVLDSYRFPPHPYSP